MTETPCVIVNVQRLGPSTGGPTAPAQGDVMQARWGTHGDHEAVVLSPSSVAETYSLTVEAFNISETLRIPVILLLDEVIGHMRESVNLPAASQLQIVERALPPENITDYRPYRAGEDGVPVIAPFGMGHKFHITGLYHGEDGFPSNKPADIEYLIKRLQSKVLKQKKEFTFYEEFMTAGAEIFVLAYGAGARAAKEAVKQARQLGISVGLLRLSTLWPFPEDVIAAVCGKARQVIVPEMNLGQLSREVEHALGKKKVRSITHVDGTALPPEKVLAAIKEAAYEQDI